MSRSRDERLSSSERNSRDPILLEHDLPDVPEEPNSCRLNCCVLVALFASSVAVVSGLYWLGSMNAAHAVGRGAMHVPHSSSSLAATQRASDATDVSAPRVKCSTLVQALAQSFFVGPNWSKLKPGVLGGLVVDADGKVGVDKLPLGVYEQQTIIDRIFELIGSTNRHAVEFGFGYSVAKLWAGLNTARLVAQGWRVDYFDALISMRSRDLNITRAVLTMDNIAREFGRAGVPRAVDYVSIDVDSVDVWLLLGLLQGGYQQLTQCPPSHRMQCPAPTDGVVLCARQAATDRASSPSKSTPACPLS